MDNLFRGFDAPVEQARRHADTRQHVNPADTTKSTQHRHNRAHEQDEHCHQHGPSFPPRVESEKSARRARGEPQRQQGNHRDASREAQRHIADEGIFRAAQAAASREHGQEQLKCDDSTLNGSVPRLASRHAIGKTHDSAKPEPRQHHAPKSKPMRQKPGSSRPQSASAASNEPSVPIDYRSIGASLFHGAFCVAVLLLNFTLYFRPSWRRSIVLVALALLGLIIYGFVSDLPARLPIIKSLFDVAWGYFGIGVSEVGHGFRMLSASVLAGTTAATAHSPPSTVQSIATTASANFQNPLPLKYPVVSLYLEKLWADTNVLNVALVELEKLKQTRASPPAWASSAHGLAEDALRSLRRAHAGYAPCYAGLAMYDRVQQERLAHLGQSVHVFNTLCVHDGDRSTAQGQWSLGWVLRIVRGLSTSGGEQFCAQTLEGLEVQAHLFSRDDTLAASRTCHADMVAQFSHVQQLIDRALNAVPQPAAQGRGLRSRADRADGASARISRVLRGTQIVLARVVAHLEEESTHIRLREDLQLQIEALAVQRQQKPLVVRESLQEGRGGSRAQGPSGRERLVDEEK
ncbi:uncharacterized protein F5Z01DRAFT_639932 [Emericellopsis atlantica]|uniref:Uncharacterized protein n=1 Tax=Emericellopsis atlantica TaxID=2614577 RepID=A0A9P8CKR5_9HYPO|nr:uncharacterized protein F5Z01DRAFT_639932 [Emericellopsis atlantica]KAG9250844.1 hypothetical protein F5Z01DRAFT_639932 [Emericellopsis atlantica]